MSGWVSKVWMKYAEVLNHPQRGGFDEGLGVSRVLTVVERL